MLTTISTANIQKASVNSIGVGSVGIGPVTIGQLVITDLELNTAADGAFMRNFVVTVTYNMKLDWHLHIELPGNVIDDSGTEDLDSPTFIIGFGDIRLPPRKGAASDETQELLSFSMLDQTRRKRA